MGLNSANLIMGSIASSARNTASGTGTEGDGMSVPEALVDSGGDGGDCRLCAGPRSARRRRGRAGLSAGAEQQRHRGPQHKRGDPARLPDLRLDQHVRRQQRGEHAIQEHRLGETPDLATAQIMVDAAADALRPNAGPSCSSTAGDYFEQVFDGYFQGWRDGYAQALNDVEDLMDSGD